MAVCLFVCLPACQHALSPTLPVCVRPIFNRVNLGARVLVAESLSRDSLVEREAKSKGLLGRIHADMAEYCYDRAG